MHQYIELYHAANVRGWHRNPLNIRLAPSELAYVLNDSGSKVVFTDALFSTLLDEPETRAQWSNHCHDRRRFGRGSSRIRDWWRWAVRSCHPSRMGRPRVLMYTGGTTGFPKGRLLQQRPRSQRAPRTLRNRAPEDGASSSRRQCSMQPLSPHPGIPASGGRPRDDPLFDPELVLHVIEQHEIDTTMVVRSCCQCCEAG